MCRTHTVRLYDLRLRAPRTYRWPCPEVLRRGHPVLRRHRSIRFVHIHRCVCGPHLHTPVQGFFSFRIYAFSRKLWIPTVIWGMSFLRLLGSLVVCITTLRMSSLARFVVQWEWFITTVWSISAANDLAITATLVVLLRHRRSTVIDLKRHAF
jgi:DNA-binding transcriptional LysR family regulator